MPAEPGPEPAVARPEAAAGHAGVAGDRAAAAARLPDRISFLGFGLIGGSIALALRAAGYGGAISAWTPGGTGPVVGVERGLIESAAPSVPAAVDGAGLVVLAGPPLASIGLATALGTELRGHLADGAIVTDVVSTKGAIVAAADAANLRFAGGHPMAGRETTGAEAATADLFVGRPWVVVPGRVAADADIASVEALATATGARPRRLDAADHDAAVAAISHLPLLVSAALVESVAMGKGGAVWPIALELAASGWRDMSRLAKGDPEMGAGILATNIDPIVERLTALRDVLDDWILRLGVEPMDADELRLRLARVRDTLEPGART